MVEIRETIASDYNFISECLKDKDYSFAEQCGYGNRFFTFPVTTEQIKNFQESRKENSLFFTILKDDLLIGSLELILNREIMVGTIARFLLHDQFRFHGYGTEALLELEKYVFESMKYKKLKLCVFEFNTSAKKCYLKSGYTEQARETRDNGWVAFYMEKRNINI